MQTANAEELFSLLGFSKDTLRFVRDSGHATHVNVLTDVDSGDIRGLMLRVIEKPEDKGFQIEGKYLYHPAGATKADEVRFLNIHYTKDGTLNQVYLHGDRLSVIENPDLKNKLPRLVGDLFDYVENRNEWVNPVKLLEKHNIGGPGNKAWPGLYVDGEVKTSHVKPEQSDQALSSYPDDFIPALAGIGPSIYSKSPTEQHIFTYHAPTSNFQLAYKYKLGSKSRNSKKPLHIDIEASLSNDASHKKQTEPVYTLQIRPDSQNEHMGAITKLTYGNHNINVHDPRAVAVFLKVVRNINRMIRAKDKAIIEDIKRPPHERRYGMPRELLLHTNAYQHLNKPANIPARGMMTFTAIGGNNITPHVSEHDTHIGANQYVIEYFKADGDKEALMIDAGLLFHDKFSASFYNAGRYFHHKYDKSHEPDNAVSALLITHRHLDHMGQLAYLIKCGYEMPPIILNEIARQKLKREMNELGIHPDIKNDIFENKCYVIDHIKDINTQNPSEITKTTIAGTTIKQWTEVVSGEDLGEKYYYPRLKIGSFDVRVGPMPHSDPGLMFDIITPAGAHRHTGDFKLDDTIKIAMPPLKPWLRAHQPDSMSMDSTGAIKEGRNPTEGDVIRSLKKIMKQRRHQRLIFPVLGSNLARLASLVYAMSDIDEKSADNKPSPARKFLIVDGKAVEDLANDANKALDFKKWALEECGIKILNRDTKAAKELLEEADPSEYALLVTGTQDEPYSSINRAARDWLPKSRFSLNDNDTICFLQGVIPIQDNKYRRLNLKRFTEGFHESEVLMPETIYKEAKIFEQNAENITTDEDGELIIHSSGHATAEDLAEAIEESGVPFMLPIHGSPEQLKSNDEICKKKGAESIVLSATRRARIERGKKVSELDFVPSGYVGITTHAPDDKFFLRGRFSSTTMPLQPPANDNSGRMMADFENALRQEAGHSSKFTMANNTPIFLSQHFNAVSHNDYLTGEKLIPFGIQRYNGQSIFDVLNIDVITTFDTETTGLDAARGRISELAYRHMDTNFTLLRQKETRKGEQRQLFQKLPDHIIPSPAAMLITGLDPENLNKDGLLPHSFAEEIGNIVDKALELSKAQRVKKGKHVTRKTDQRAIFAAHNLNFDTNFIEKEMGRNGIRETKPFSTRNALGIDTRSISRAIVGFTPSDSDYKVRTKKAEDGRTYDDHTLEGLLIANKIPYNANAAHGAVYDTKICADLLQHQYNIAPEIVEQMVYNADKTKHALVNDIIGMETGFGGPHPIFSYISDRSSHPAPQMGCYMGSLDSERYLVVFNLKYDPLDYVNRPVDELVELINDRNNDVFEIVDIKKTPIIMPASFGLRVKAQGRLSKETLDQRAGVIKRHMNPPDHKSNWKTLPQKLDEAWRDHRNDIIAKRIRPTYKTDKGYPNVKARTAQIDRLVPPPEYGIGELRAILYNNFNPVHGEIRQALSSYIHYLRGKEPKKKKDSDWSLSKEARIEKYYLQLMQFKSELGKAQEIINQIQYDVDPKIMSANDRNKTEAHREFISTQTYNQAVEQVKQIESDPALYAHYIGKSRKKKALFEKIKKWLDQRSGLSIFTERAKSLAHPWRPHTRNDLSYGL